MKPVQIDFVVPRAWKFIWATAAVVVLAIITTTGVRAWQLRQLRMALDGQLAALQTQQLQRLANAKSVEHPQHDPRAANEANAHRLLQSDWNRVYDAIETPALAKVRLIQLSMDAITGQARLEYELESMTQAEEVTRALNEASRQEDAWQLERLESTGQGDLAGPAKVKGVWRGVLN